jgi:hypothetical protein
MKLVDELTCQLSFQVHHRNARQAMRGGRRALPVEPTRFALSASYRAATTSKKPVVAKAAQKRWHRSGFPENTRLRGPVDRLLLPAQLDQIKFHGVSLGKGAGWSVLLQWRASHGVAM